MQRSFESEKGRLAANGALWVIRKTYVTALSSKTGIESMFILCALMRFALRQ